MPRNKSKQIAKRKIGGTHPPRQTGSHYQVPVNLRPDLGPGTCTFVKTNDSHHMNAVARLIKRQMRKFLSEIEGDKDVEKKPPPRSADSGRTRKERKPRYNSTLGSQPYEGIIHPTTAQPTPPDAKPIEPVDDQL